MAPRLDARIVRVPLLIGALVVALVISRRWPTDQTVRVVLGDAAPGVQDITVRYGEPSHRSDASDDWQREVTFHYAAGRAPRIVSHELRLVNGDYDVEVDIGRGGAHPEGTVTVVRRVTLEGHVVSLDVSHEASAAPEGGQR